MNWWRAHHGISNDVKVGIVAAKVNATKSEVGWTLIILLDYASQNDRDRGSIDGLEIDEIAAMAGIDIGKTAQIIEALRDRKIISPENRLTNWEKRQFDGDYSTMRVRKFRKKRNETPGTFQPFHETLETSEQNRTDTEQSRAEQNVPPIQATAPKIAQMPPRGPRASWESVNEAWKWYQIEYPAEVNAFIELQLFISVVETEDDIADLFKNLPAYKLTQKWMDGFGPSSENFLSKRIFKVPPKARDTSTAPKTRQQANADLWSQA